VIRNKSEAVVDRFKALAQTDSVKERKCHRLSGKAIEIRTLYLSNKWQAVGTEATATPAYLVNEQLEMRKGVAGSSVPRTGIIHFLWTKQSRLFYLRMGAKSAAETLCYHLRTERWTKSWKPAVLYFDYIFLFFHHATFLPSHPLALFTQTKLGEEYKLLKPSICRPRSSSSIPHNFSWF
jgi:hypothetical protein